ncbi:MAG: hypothetical protein Q9P01_07915 [Anaerolineae bacterium]|nr:hypothetical protein [Anaerolineae bacterium]
MSLVGVGSVGKSNLLQHLADEDVQVHFMGDRAKNFKPIMIDPNLLGPIDSGETEQIRCWAGYELMMHRLYLSFYPFDVLGSEVSSFIDVYQALQDGTNPLYAYMGLRYFELGLEFFLRRGIQLVFMFDEFEELFRQMPPKFFQTLRGLRDNHKSRLSFLAFSREPIPVMVEKMGLPELLVEPFTELFTDNVYYVGPYNSVDAQAMVDRLVQRNPQQNISNHAIEFLLRASGRYAGILRAGFRSLEWLGNVAPNDIDSQFLVDKLASRRPVQAECETIWKSLTDIEQQVLKFVARQKVEDSNAEAERAVALLVQKRLLLVDHQRQSLHIQPPVFYSYIQKVILRP